MSKLAHSNDQTMIEIEGRSRDIHDGPITHCEWYEAQNRIGQLTAALTEIITEATVEIDGVLYAPSGFVKVTQIARAALKTPNAELRGGPAVSSPERPA